MSDEPTAPSDGPAAPGWYPEGEGERWWDGRAWTAYTRPAGGGEAGAPVTASAQPSGARPRRSTLAILALVFGIAAIVLAAAVRIIPIVGFAPGVAALVFGIVVLARREPGRGFGITGIVLGALVILSTAGNLAIRSQTAALDSGADPGGSVTLPSAAPGGSSAAAPSSPAAEATASAADEQRYLETAIDALTEGLQGTTLTGADRKAAHQKADAQLLSTGYQTCRALDASSQTPQEFADEFVKSFAASGASDSAARKVGRKLIPAIGADLCPSHEAELQEAADDL